MRKPTVLVLCCVLLSAFVTACGSNSVSVLVEMAEFKFTPDLFEVPAGAEVNLIIENKGSLEHEFAIMVFGANATIPFDGDDEENVFWEQKAAAGERISVTFTAPTETGEYQIVCGIPAHLELGMAGTMLVK